MDACPEIDGGAGKVVLATFQRTADNLLDISLSGLDSPLEVTGNHPIWSMDRNDWTKAGELHIGEHLLGQAGQLVTVESITADPGTYTVYNMAVEGDHRYLVTNLGVVVHNACGIDPTNPYRKTGLPTRNGNFRFIPPEESTLSNIIRGPQGGYMDKFGNEWVKGRPHHFLGDSFEWDVQLPGGGHLDVSIRGIVAN